MATQQWTRAQLAAAPGCLITIDGVVYDVTRYLGTHPGGAEVLQQVAGTDASQQFHDLGHSADAQEAMAQYAVGELSEREGPRTQRQGSAQGSAAARILGVLVVVLAAFYMFLPR